MGPCGLALASVAAAAGVPNASPALSAAEASAAGCAGLPAGEAAAPAATQLLGSCSTSCVRLGAATTGLVVPPTKARTSSGVHPGLSGSIAGMPGVVGSRLSLLLPAPSEHAAPLPLSAAASVVMSAGSGTGTGSAAGAVPQGVSAVGASSASSASEAGDGGAAGWLGMTDPAGLGCFVAVAVSAAQSAASISLSSSAAGRICDAGVGHGAVCCGSAGMAPASGDSDGGRSGAVPALQALPQSSPGPPAAAAAAAGVSGSWGSGDGLVERLLPLSLWLQESSASEWSGSSSSGEPSVTTLSWLPMLSGLSGSRNRGTPMLPWLRPLLVLLSLPPPLLSAPLAGCDAGVALFVQKVPGLAAPESSIAGDSVTGGLAMGGGDVGHDMTSSAAAAHMLSSTVAAQLLCCSGLES